MPPLAKEHRLRSSESARRSQKSASRRLGSFEDGSRKNRSVFQPFWLSLVVLCLMSTGYTVHQFHREVDSQDHPEVFQSVFSAGSLRSRLAIPSQTYHSVAKSQRQLHQEGVKQTETKPILIRNRLPAKQNEQAPILSTWIDDFELPEPTKWKILKDDAFNQTAFEERLSSWRAHRQALHRERYQSWLRHSTHTAPNRSHVHQTPAFPRSLSWDVMVVVMADPKCLWVDKKGQVNATARLLSTLEDVLQSRMVDVVTYLPHYHDADTTKCHKELHQAVLSTFPKALEQGQLQIVSSPPLHYDRGHEHRYAMNGLDFSYATELAAHYADSILFVQAGSQLSPKWWIQTEAPENSTSTEDSSRPSSPEASLVTIEVPKNFDYALEIMKAWENRDQYDDQNLAHQTCYMNFARNVGDRVNRLGKLENPSGSLWEKSQLMRFSLTIRSYAPYGKFPVANILKEYCREMLWEARMPVSPVSLFWHNYTVIEKESKVVPKPEDLPIPNASSYPYITVSPKEVPCWVTVHPSMVGPHAANGVNPLLQNLQDSAMFIPNAALHSNTEQNQTQSIAGLHAVNGVNPFLRRLHDRAADAPTAAPIQLSIPEQNWVTFVIPTAWRHGMPGEVKGNAYVVKCIRQLLEILQSRFPAKYKSSILAVVSGRDEADIARHHKGLEAEFRHEIREGLVKLMDAPIDSYPTLHNLNNNYGDNETRVQWRSKQNLDISSALFAAKGMGKYIMMIEDDSSFTADKLFNGIRDTIVFLHREYSPDDAAEYNPRRAFRVRLRNQIVDQDPAETDLGHREIWSQVRFSFGYSGVLIHDEDALVFGMMHFLLYDEKPCDMSFAMAENVRNGINQNHALRFNDKYRFIQHAGKHSTLQGKVWADV